MNTKYNSSASGPVPRTLGRPVGVLPLGPRSALGLGQRRSGSIERRPLQKNASTSSISSARSDLSNTSETSLANENGISRRLKKSELNKATQRSGRKQNISGSGCSFLKNREKLDLSQESEPYKVYEVDLHGEELTTAPDLEKFRKLRVLDLSGNHIKQINGLDFNWDLRELKLYDNAITSIEGFDNLKELCHLQLQHNQISKIGRGLGSLKKLQTLRLDNNKLIKIETPELLSCANITTLDLSSNRLETLAALSYLPNLEELLASGNCLKSTGDLGKCRKLQEVDLSWNQLSDLGGLANLPNIQILDVCHNNLTCLKSVGKLRSLEELNINANRISELSSFASAFQKLQILFVCDNMISAWDEVCSLEKLPDLVELYISANPFTMEDGDMPAYVSAISVVLPKLEVLDGAQIKRSDHKLSGAPLMRPMSAASIISVRQVDSQLKAAAHEQEDFHKSIADKFASLRSLVDSLPSQPPRPSTSHSLISSRCSSRSRLREARDFAAVNFDDDDEDVDEKF
ncbi:protein phosphatase 1 regulatory subunit 7-like [Plakobranchus ocellatus]|uniref:Protein phosphatase 1 regulatory subunit 7-like n=1 Tax=Plakobranchus ocellatus TaxID=259542 RepID=A0AAV4D2G4_9GAST|nr:protein phosphatase 1 regulatory subunit 7-like [Plakobranchus ocellatus]